MEKKTRYTMVNKRGEEIYHFDSFLGFIGSTILVGLLAFVGLSVIAAICCWIGSFFN